MTGSGWQTRPVANATGLLRLDYKLDPIGATFYGRPFCTVTCVTPTSASIAGFKHHGGVSGARRRPVHLRRQQGRDRASRWAWSRRATRP